MGLNEIPQEIPITTVDQTPGKTTGPVGRLIDIQNCTVEHYVPTQGGPQRLKTKQRKAFVSLTTDTHDPETGDANNLSWSNSELLSQLGDQTVSVCDSIPRVYNGNDFTGYADKRSVVSKFEQHVFHTSDRTIQADDSAWISGVTCAVWTETYLSNGVPRTAAFIGFRSDDGAWIIPPNSLEDQQADVTIDVTMARTCIDGDRSRFWVVVNTNGEGRALLVLAYDLNGKLIATDTITQFAQNPGPGYWDITPCATGGIYIAQPGTTPDGTTDVGVEVSNAVVSMGTIVITAETDPAMHCSGPVAWISNDFDSKAYVATYLKGSGRYVYQVTGVAQSHEFHVATTDTNPDSLIGWVKDSGVTNHPDVYVGWTTLTDGTASSGPQWDPALRFSEVYKCTWGNVSTKIKQIDGVCFVSRAFRHDNDWYAVTYYQSGSGLTVTDQQIDVTWTSGDYMIGAPEQTLPVVVGDLVTGSSQVFSVPAGGAFIVNTATVGSSGIGAGDKVEYIANGPFDGSPVLKWTFAGMSVDNATIAGARLRIGGSPSIPTAVGDWEVVGADITNPAANFVYTQITAVGGGTVIPGTFTAAGTKQIIGMTFYRVDLPSVYDQTTAKRFLVGSTMIVTDNPTPANNGTKTIARAIAIPVSTFAPTEKFQFVPGIWVVTGSETTSTGGFNATVNPVSVNAWEFPAINFFGNVLTVGPHSLVVSGDEFLINGAIASNDGDRQITSVPGPNIVVTDGYVLPEIFNNPLPSIKIRVPLDVQPYTFKLQSVTLDYKLRNALIVVADAEAQSNNGTYRVTDLNVADGLIYAVPADGRSGQFSESFSNSVTITIILSNSIAPVFQPKWFMTPLSPGIDTSHVGRFEDGLAYADWRYEGDDSLPPNMFLLGVTSVVDRTFFGKQFVLPYRAKSFTSGQPLVSASGQILSDAAQTLFQSTVGLKSFVLSLENGEATEAASELILPGPMTSVFSDSGFNEQGISVSPEMPYVVSQGAVESGTFITPGTTHQYVVVWKVTLENGDTVVSAPSPPLDVVLTGTNNYNVIGGRFPLPLDSGGVPVANEFGLSNYKMISAVITRTSYRSDVPTIQHFEITNPLSVNGLAPVSDLNSSGFSFPDHFTWQYRDANPDVDILSSEVLYTDKGYLPRFPARPSNAGCIWKNREWLVCDDGSVQMSGEKTEGDAYWHFPGFRFTFGNDFALNCRPMGNYLIVGCRDSFWYIPFQDLPDAGGRNGKLPNPVEITDVKQGTTGIMCQIDGGVAYSSTAGGVWAITSDFQSKFLSINYKDDLSLTADAPASMVVDKFQRLAIATNGTHMYIYDQISKAWYKWILPSVAKFVTNAGGFIAFQDNARIFVQSPVATADVVDNNLFGIPWLLKFADISFGSVRRFKNCWEFQVFGDYIAPHRLIVELRYPQTNEPATDFPPALITTDDPYLFSFNPRREDAPAFGLTLACDFEGIETPGDSAEIEFLNAVLGVESGLQQTQRRL